MLLAHPGIPGYSLAFKFDPRNPRVPPSGIAYHLRESRVIPTWLVPLPAGWTMRTSPVAPRGGPPIGSGTHGPVGRLTWVHGVPMKRIHGTKRDPNINPCAVDGISQSCFVISPVFLVFVAYYIQPFGERNGAQGR